FRVSSDAWFVNVPAPTAIYTLSLHDALPIWGARTSPPSLSGKVLGTGGMGMSEATAWLLRGARIHQGTQWADEAVLAAVGGRIAYVGDLRKLPRRLEGAGVEVGRQSLEEIHTEGGYLCPGFIDVHLHGGGGADVMDASPGALSQLARTHARHGTVAFLPTTVTAPYEQLHRVLEAVEETAGAREEGAELLGVHLEGPHLNPARAGAQNPEFLTPPSLPEMQALLERFPGRVRWVTVAPELEGARELIQYLREAGVVVSIGHSDATYEQAMVAFQWGISHATHTFNGMNPLHHRAPGVPGAVLTAPGVSAEIIADGFHIHPGVARLLWQVKGPDRLLLVTDAMRATDLPDGRYDLGGLEVDVVGGGGPPRGAGGPGRQYPHPGAGRRLDGGGGGALLGRGRPAGQPQPGPAAGCSPPVGQPGGREGCQLGPPG